MGSFCPRNMTHKFKPAEFHPTCCGEKILSPLQVFFAETDVTRGKLSLQNVRGACLRNMSSCVCRSSEVSVRCLLTLGTDGAFQSAVRRLWKNLSVLALTVDSIKTRKTEWTANDNAARLRRNYRDLISQ